MWKAADESGVVGVTDDGECNAPSRGGLSVVNRLFFCFAFGGTPSRPVRCVRNTDHLPGQPTRLDVSAWMDGNKG